MMPGTLARGRLALAGLAVTLVAVTASLVLIVGGVCVGAGSEYFLQPLTSLTLGVTFAVVGWVVASRESHNPLGWIFVVIGVSQSVQAFSALASVYGLVLVPGSVPLAALFSWVAVWSWAPGFGLLVTFSLLLFPDGRLPSRKWRVIAWLSVAMILLVVAAIAIQAWPRRGIALTIPSDSGNDQNLVLFTGVLLVPIVALASVASIVLRFRRSTGQARQQLKWFTYAAVPEVAFLVVVLLLSSPPLVVSVATIFILPLMPIAVGIAILRYRLYDIDRIISRTIAYAVVTGLLAATFGAIVLVLQAALTQYTQGETIAVAGSTLAVFALFQPLLQRVRRAVDRRFDRARYDAERTAAAFSERLRDEVDMASTQRELLATVIVAVQPRTADVWIRGSGGAR